MGGIVLLEKREQSELKEKQSEFKETYIKICIKE